MLRSSRIAAETLTSPGAPKTVAIVGGGLAGISAAAALTQSGFVVDLIEKRPLLGGRASSHTDSETGDRIDECQHGTMRCCTALSDLLTRLGVYDKIDWHESLHFLDGNGVQSSISNCGLPAPGHTSISFLRFRSLSMVDKIAISRAMLAMLRSAPSKKWEEETIGDWFVRMKQTPRAIQRFWAPILVSTCNETIDRISCTHAFKIFREGFLLNAVAYQFGVPKLPLATLYSDPAQALIERAGGKVRVKAIADRILFDDDSKDTIRGIALTTGEVVEADHYILALQCDLLMKLMPKELTDGIEYWQNIRSIELSPIVAVHLWFEGKVECPPALALLDRQTEWVFNKNLNYGLDNSKTTYLSALISASHRYRDVPNQKILEVVLSDLRHSLPGLANSRLKRSKVIKWPKATFSPLPGVERLRPIQKSPISNLYVAGEWTSTGWPSTMESAVRSGYLAAEYILEHAGMPAKLIPADLPVGAIARLLSR